MPATATRTERLEARISPDQKALFQWAAQLQGRSLTDFVIDALQAAADEAIRSHHIRLTAQESAAFVAALLDAPEPDERLNNAARRYRAFMGE